MIVREFLDDRGQSPFRNWLVRLDTPTRARVQARILRFETGNLGDHKHVGDGVCKGSQSKDLKRAREFWAQYLEALRHGEAK